MKTLVLSLAALGGAATLGLAPLSAANAQTDMTPAAAQHGDWTLGQREDWLGEQLKTSLANGALDKAEFNRARLEMDHLRQEESRMRHDGKGQLTDNQTAELKARLDTMADKIHWANISAYKRPW
jgi:Spy/CpxP family protein refolding chaperone